MRIEHHGAVDGVTGSCHQLFWNDGADSVLVDCGLFQGDEASPRGASREAQQLDFDVSTVRALVVSHCHLDHVGRIPHLLAAGFQGPVYCSQPTARLLPAVMEDAVKVGLTRDARLVASFVRVIEGRIKALPYGEWAAIAAASRAGEPLEIRLRRAGHILGSAYVQARTGRGGDRKQALFSGDLGAPYTPLLTSPRPPYSADILVLESTYGDRLHEDRRHRRGRLKALVEKAFENRGALLIPAFSIGRTQELLYELEGIVTRHGAQEAARGLHWDRIDVIVDSPLAARFTEHYRALRLFWDREARRRVRAGRHPLSFEQMLTVDSHDRHLWTVDYLRRSGRPAIVVAASGMCTGGRIVNYLKALIGEPRTDILFVGYQAAGTPGRDIQKYGPRNGYVDLDGARHTIAAGVHTLHGYSAHADQAGLVRFVTRMRRPPGQIRLVHGDPGAKADLRARLLAALPGSDVRIPGVSA